MNDLRFALRQLVKNPGFTAVAVVTLALGIGANTAVFSVVNAVLLRPLPYREPGRLVMLCESKAAAGTAQSVVSTTAFAEWRKRCRSVEQSAAVRFDNFVLGGDGRPERLLLCQASADYFPLLGLKPVLGRAFLPEEERDGEGYGRVVVLGHALWRRRFAADPSIVGKAIELNGLPHTVVGVMGPEAGRFFHPKDLAGWPAGLGEPELWRPLPVDWALRVSPDVRWLLVVGRLADGATAAQATAELEAISADLARANPAQYAGWGAAAVPLHEQVVRGSRGPLLVLAAATAAVLLMACANVANLMLVASARRGAEFAVRAALGAGRGALVRQVLVEAMLLALVGGGAGLLAAAWAVGAIASHAPLDLPRAWDATLDAPALCFALGATVMTGLLFGLAPALQAHAGDLNLALTAAGRGAGAGRAARRQARLLVTTEVALALPLLLCTGLLARSLVRLLEVDPGFRPQEVLVADVSLLHRDYREVSPRIQFVERVLDRVHALPGVTSAAVAYGVPFGSMLNAQDFVTVAGAPEPPPGERLLADQRMVSPAYFQTLGIPVLRGRPFEPSDRRGAPKVAIVNTALARRLFGGEDVVGRSVDVGDGAEKSRCEIVGVLGDVKGTGLDQGTPPEFYLCQFQFCDLYLSLAVRTSGDPAALAEALRREVHAVDPGRPVYNVRLLERQVDESVSPRRFTVLLVGSLAALAAVLAAVGIYGVLAHSVAQRSREIGVRMAMGARPRDVVWLVVAQGMAPTLAGLAAGAGVALAGRRLMAGVVFGVSPTDPYAFAAAVALLSAVALAACALPARRAARVDPMEALRHE